MAATIYYDNDADLSLLKDKTIVLAAAEVGPASAAELRARLEPHLRRTVCSSSEMRRFMAPGVTAVYNYRTEDGRELVRIAVALSDCSGA